MSGTLAVTKSEFDESLSLWLDWARDFALRCARGEVHREAAVDLIWSNTLMPVFNQAVISGSLGDQGTLAEMIGIAESYAASRPVPWLIAVFEDRLGPDLLTALPQVMEQRGFEVAFQFTGMGCNSLVAPQLPPELSFRRVTSPQDGNIAGDLNCNAYGMPLEMGRDFFSHPIVNGSDCMYLGIVDGQPVSTAAVTPVDGRLYASFVATEAAHQRKGYAGAVLYHALTQAMRETGLTRTFLHASRAGYKVYERMGYYPINEVSIWTKH